jgi:cytochrome c oxidase assembly protein subunit 11
MHSVEQRPEGQSRSEKSGHGPLIRRLAVMAVAMFGFGFLLVPLYDLLCEITGIGGRTAAEAAVVTDLKPDLTREVTVEFVAVLNQQAPWEFRPAVTSMKVHPGQLYDTTFSARNLTARALVAQAIPSVAPGIAARHFKKTDCFCFEQQAFAAGEQKDMGVQFMVDPQLPAHVDRVTLSYTFFAIKPAATDTTTTTDS